MDRAGFHTGTSSFSFSLHLSLSWCLSIFFFFLLPLVHFSTLSFLQNIQTIFPFPSPSLIHLSKYFPSQGPSVVPFLQCTRAPESAEPSTRGEDEDNLPSGN